MEKFEIKINFDLKKRQLDDSFYFVLTIL